MVVWRKHFDVHGADGVPVEEEKPARWVKFYTFNDRPHLAFCYWVYKREKLGISVENNDRIQN